MQTKFEAPSGLANDAIQAGKSPARGKRTKRNGKRWSLLTGLGIQKMVFRQIPAPALILAAALWSEWLVGVSASFSMVVEHGVEECFVIRAPKEKSVIRYAAFIGLFLSHVLHKITFPSLMLYHLFLSC